MTGDDFHTLATRYLEDAIDERERRHLNRELLDSPERVRQFNDLRMLAGMILEHGRPEKDQPEIVDFPESEPRQKKTRQWLSAAALLVAGLLVGIPLGSSWKRDREANSDPGGGSANSVNLVDGGFEQPEPAKGFPMQPGSWAGDGVEVIPNGNTKVEPREGNAMLCLAAPALPPAPFAPEPQRAVQWQIVDLGVAKRTSKSMVASLRTRFNRDQEVLNPELPCRVELFAFRGSPKTAQAQLGSKSYLATSATNFQTDSDPRTWELVETSLRVPPGTDFLLLGVSGFGERLPMPKGGEAYSGHYADDVELNLSETGSSPAKP